MRKVSQDEKNFDFTSSSSRLEGEESERVSELVNIIILYSTTNVKCVGWCYWSGEARQNVNRARGEVVGEIGEAERVKRSEIFHSHTHATVFPLLSSPHSRLKDAMKWKQMEVRRIFCCVNGERWIFIFVFLSSCSRLPPHTHTNRFNGTVAHVRRVLIASTRSIWSPLLFFGSCTMRVFYLLEGESGNKSQPAQVSFRGVTRKCWNNEEWIDGSFEWCKLVRFHLTIWNDDDVEDLLKQSLQLI